MGIFNKFINAVSINDADDYEDDEFYDEEDEVEEPPKEKKKGFFSRIMGSKDQEEEEFYDDEPVKAKPEPKRTYTSPASEQSSSASRYSKPAKPVSKVTPMRKRSGKNMEVFVIKPSNMEDTREIADTLLANCTVVLNLEGLDVEMAQRVIDFSSGACYSIDGSLQKVSNYIFILTPANVGISGDITDILGSTIPSMRSSY